MAAGFARKLSAAGLSQRYAASAATILAQMVMPALDSQIAELAKLRPAASHDAGVWRLPDGERSYAASLGIETTTDPAAADLHNLDLELAPDTGTPLPVMFNIPGYGPHKPPAPCLDHALRP